MKLLSRNALRTLVAVATLTAVAVAPMAEASASTHYSPHCKSTRQCMK